MKFLYNSITLFLLLVTISSSAQNIIYVDSNALGSNTGDSWANAYYHIQTALSNFSPGDTIWVAEGTYYPVFDRTGYQFGSNEYKTFALPDKCVIYGGFAGDETSLEEREWREHPVILNGDLGTTGSYSGNCYNIIYNPDTAYVDGFSIMYGSAIANYSTEYGYGGGIKNDGQLQVKNCLILANQALNGGGVFTKESSSLTLENTIIADNGVNYTGWGPSGYGGGLSAETTSEVTITNCVIYNNTAYWGGSGINTFGTCNPVITNTIIWNNVIDAGTLSYCCIPDSTGNGNINDDPMLMDPDNYDFSLQRESPCINTGNPVSPNDEDGTRADIGAIPFEHDTIDLGIIEFDFLEKEKLTGNQDVTITIKNYGTETITSVDIGWSVDGSTQTPLAWTGSLALRESKDSVLLGNYNFTHDVHTVSAWIIDPNGKADEYTQNDTLVKTKFFCDSIMSGTYTIGTTGKYSNFGNAVEALCNCGIDDPVYFDVADGLYYEQVTLNPVPGASLSDTIVFASTSGVAKNTLLFYQPADELQPYTILYDSADYISFKDMVIGTRGRSFGKAIGFLNGATNNNIFGCGIVGDDTTETIIYCNSNSGYANSYNTIKRNYILGGHYGIYWRGKGSAYSDYLLIDSNYFNNYVYLEYHRYTELRNNYFDISEDNTWNSHLFTTLYSMDLLLDGNYFIKRNRRNYNALNFAYTSGSPKMINNIITGDENYLVYVGIASNSLDLTNNTIYQYNITEGIPLVLSADGSDLYNNNIVNASRNVAIWFQAEPNTTNSDYNNIYSAGKYIVGVGSTGYKTIEDWNAAKGIDGNSVSAYTGFMADTLMYTFVSVLDSAGTNTVGVNVDIEGKPRDPDYPDIGATEFITPGPASGTFIVGSSPSANKPTLQQMIDSLAMVGVKGNIEIQIEQGSYNEQVVIPQIYGLNDSCRLKITSLDGDSSSVIFDYDLENHQDFVFCLNGADYIDIEKLSFQSLDSTYSKNLYIKNYANHNTIKNNSFFAPQNDSYNQLDDALVYCTGYSHNDNLFENNLFVNGSSGIAFYKDYDDADTTYNTDIIIKRNKFIDQYQYGIYSNDFYPVIIEANYFNARDWGTDYTAFLFMDIPFAGTKITNNIIDIPRRFPIKTYNCDSMDFVHNTIRMLDGYGPQFSNTPVCFMNNIIANGTDRSLLEADTSLLNENYNMYYGPAWDFETNKLRLGLGDSSFYANPKLTGDVVLTPGSVLVNNVGFPFPELTSDYMGNTRGSRPDLGAVESNYTYVLDDVIECAYNIAELDAGEGFDTYFWSVDSTSRTIHIDSSGIGMGSETFSVDVAFRGNSYSDDFTLYFTQPSISLGNDIFACVGDTLILDAGDGGDTYAWKLNPWTLLGEERYLTVTQSYTNLTATLTDTLTGCESTDTIGVAIQNGPQSVYMYVREYSNRYLEIESYDENVDSVLWYIDDALVKSVKIDKSGSQPYGDTLTVSGSGTYEAVVVAENGCTKSPDPYVYTSIELIVSENNAFYIYPLPAKNDLNIQSDLSGQFELSIVNMEGKIIQNKTANITRDANYILDISAINAGMYFLYIKGENISQVLKILVE